MKRSPSNVSNGKKTRIARSKVHANESSSATEDHHVDEDVDADVHSWPWGLNDAEAVELSSQQEADKSDARSNVMDNQSDAEYNTAMPSTSMVASSDESRVTRRRNRPDLLDGELFEIIAEKNGRCTVVCKTCPGKKIVKGTLKSTGNFISHIKRIHPSLIKRMEEKRVLRKEGIHALAIGRTKFVTPTSKDALQVISDYVINEMQPQTDQAVVGKQAFKTAVTSSSLKTFDSSAHSSAVSRRNLPDLLDGELFEVTSVKNRSCAAICKNCPGKKAIKGTFQSTGNFISHIRRKHPFLIKRMEEKRTRRKEIIDTQLATSKTPVHAYLRNESKFHVSMKEAQEAISNFVINELLPLSIVEKPSFQNLIAILAKGNPQPIHAPDRKSFVAHLEKKYQTMLNKLKETLNSQEHVCTTADIWTRGNRTFLGMTCHFIDGDSLERKSLVLACQSIEFQRITYDEIAETINAVHDEYAIVGKVTHIITDNLISFGKPLLCCIASDQTLACDDAQHQHGHTTARRTDDDDDDHAPDDDVNIGEINFLTEALSQSCMYNALMTPQLRCCSNSLNIIATLDVHPCKIAVQFEQTGYEELHQSTFQKVSALCNLLSQSKDASKLYERMCKKKFKPVPTHTRWNALYDAVKSLLLDKVCLDSLLEALKIAPLTAIELEFLEEYTRVMRPLVDGLAILQEEQHGYLGTVLPTLLSIQKRVEACRNLSHCGPLQQTILASLEKHFLKVLDLSCDESDAFVLASVSHPRFKMTWVMARYVEKTKALFISACEQMQNVITDCQASARDDARASAESDFFSVLNGGGGGDVDHEPRSANNASLQALHFLEDADTSLSSLQRFPAVKAVFMKHNTALPSSAPVERFLSSEGQLLMPRGGLSELHFEMLLLLRSNLAALD